MEILNKGSFVPLDNRERVGQMIFTAKTFAAEIAKNAGFQNNGPTNQQLALEMWKGSEYMTRAHEEATIKNLFLSNFLKELCEAVEETNGKPVSALPQPIGEPPSGETSISGNIEETVKANSSDDEFLGIVSSEEPTTSKESRPSYADECKPECEDEIVEMINCSAKEMPGSQTDNISVPETPPTTAPATIAASASLTSTTESEPATQRVAVVDSRSITIAPIVLAEEEPFNFDSCTITAVIQLLPISDGFRKCVVSVRSHDFLPIINIDRLTAGRIRDEVKVSLEKALITYRSELPALAAEKMKKYAQANKKAANKSSSTSKSPSKTVEASGKSAESESNIDSTEETSEAPKNQQTLFAQ